MFKDNLKTIRKEKGLSQEFLAKELNVVRQTISKWEKGLSIPDGDMLIKISQILDTPVEVLLGCEISLENKDEVTQALQLQIINNLLENSSRRGGRMSGTMLLGLFISIVGLVFSVSIMVLATFNNVYLSDRFAGCLGTDCKAIRNISRPVFPVGDYVFGRMHIRREAFIFCFPEHQK